MTTPHVFVGKSPVPFNHIGVLALYGVVGQMKGFVKVVQIEDLRAESQVTFSTKIVPN